LVGTLVGRLVGLDVIGFEVGLLVGLLVGRPVGLNVIGFEVGLLVGPLVAIGAAVGLLLG
jgi:hypothetical protein